MIPCDASQDAIQASLDGRLDPESRERLEAHLAACADCRAYQAALIQLDGALSAPTPAPAALLERLELATPASPRRRPRWAWAAAAGFIVAVGLGVTTLAPTTPPTTIASAPNTAEVPVEPVLSWLEPEAPDEVVLPSDLLFADAP